MDSFGKGFILDRKALYPTQSCDMHAHTRTHTAHTTHNIPVLGEQLLGGHFPRVFGTALQQACQDARK